MFLNLTDSCTDDGISINTNDVKTIRQIFIGEKGTRLVFNNGGEIVVKESRDRIMKCLQYGENKYENCKVYFVENFMYEFFEGDVKILSGGILLHYKGMIEERSTAANNFEDGGGIYMDNCEKFIPMQYVRKIDLDISDK